MNPVNKKAQMICMIPTAIAIAAVMIYCFATNVGGNQPLVYALIAGVAVYLLMYLLVGRRMQAQSSGGKIDLSSHLTSEEIRILVADLNTAAERDASRKAAYTVLASKISISGKVNAGDIPLCVAAVDAGLGVFSAFGLAPAGHSALKEKLQKLAG